MSKSEFKIVFNELLLENFGPLQTEHIILTNTLLKKQTFDKYNKTKELINSDKMYRILEISEFLYGLYYLKYKRGDYGFYNKKSS